MSRSSFLINFLSWSDFKRILAHISDVVFCLYEGHGISNNVSFNITFKESQLVVFLTGSCFVSLNFNRQTGADQRV